MGRNRDGIPEYPLLFTALVTSSRRLSPSFQRVTVASPELAEFPWQRDDHWFRLFLPRPESPDTLNLPDDIEGPEWWPRLKRTPEDQRPHLSNYTVADLRIEDRDGTEYGVMDIDVVLHADELGEFSAPVAAWAVSARPGSPVALLDQGIIYLPPEDADHIVIASDEAGLPGVRQVIRGLEPQTTGSVFVEVADPEDIEDWATPTGVTVEWFVRAPEDTPGAPTVAAVQGLTDVPATTYAYLVGESKLATGARRAMVGHGVPKDRITFSGFWRHD
ncbi:siderophore-interacting protein [Galactobacter sp.]|uniref:siderophore-interacting protein n=1 Tax=Galactobacter sp. TaxID=2676125 RepID=UPI0025BEF9B7|nr:siderophore-interacting protein [Galactobacter sp.]